MTEGAADAAVVWVEAELRACALDKGFPKPQLLLVASHRRRPNELSVVFAFPFARCVTGELVETASRLRGSDPCGMGLSRLEKQWFHTVQARGAPCTVRAVFEVGEFVRCLAKGMPDAVALALPPPASAAAPAPGIASTHKVLFATRSWDELCRIHARAPPSYASVRQSLGKAAGLAVQACKLLDGTKDGQNNDRHADKVQDKTILARSAAAKSLLLDAMDLAERLHAALCAVRERAAEASEVAKDEDGCNGAAHAALPPSPRPEQRFCRACCRLRRRGRRIPAALGVSHRLSVRTRLRPQRPRWPAA